MKKVISNPSKMGNDKTKKESGIRRTSKWGASQMREVWKGEPPIINIDTRGFEKESKQDNKTVIPSKSKEKVATKTPSKKYSEEKINKQKDKISASKEIQKESPEKKESK